MSGIMQTDTALIIDKRKWEKQRCNAVHWQFKDGELQVCQITSVIHSFTAQHPLVARHFLLGVHT